MGDKSQKAQKTAAALAKAAAPPQAKPPKRGK